jgi:hypothetical protein
VPVPVTILAALEVKHGDQIHLARSSIRVIGVPLPGFVVDRIMRQVNPIADLSRGGKSPFALKISRLRVAPSTLSAIGRVRPA